MIEGHTLVVPTYNRTELLGRLVRHYCSSSPGMRILVLDSSRADVMERNKTALAQCGGSVSHLAFPDTTPFALKLAQGLESVETPYASFCADDDLVFLPGLRSAIDYLANHADYVCAHGLYLNFQTSGHDVMLMREYAGPGNDAEHPGARIFRLCQRYESLFYAAFRTPDLRTITRAVALMPTLHYQELLQSVAALILGKVARVPLIYGARQSCPPAQPERDKWQTYYWYADDPAEFLAHYRDYRDAVWTFFAEHCRGVSLTRTAFDRTMDLAHTVYFSAGCPPEYFYSKLQEYFPQDSFNKPARDDLLAQLRPVDPAPTQRKVMGAWLRWQRARLARLRASRRSEAASALQALDARVASESRTPWHCKLPAGLAWLPQSEAFQASYVELCRYLDAA